jgi:hypothetical protein
MEEDPTCLCAGGRFGGDNFESTDLGTDRRYGEVSLIRCRRCRCLWLHYYDVQEAFTGSGRWYHGLIAPELEGAISAEKALEILGKLDGYWCGGSFFDGRVFRATGVPELRP